MYTNKIVFVFMLLELFFFFFFFFFFSCSISFNLNYVHNIECWQLHILESQRTRIAETTLNQRLFNVFTLENPKSTSLRPRARTGLPNAQEEITSQTDQHLVILSSRTYVLEDKMARY